MDQASLPFAGIRVLDIASFIAAPVAATIFADYGADVIKVEPPGHGDPNRQTWELASYPKAGVNFPWEMDSRGKRSIALDLRSRAGREVLYRLVNTIDIVITTYGCVAMEEPPAAKESASAAEGVVTAVKKTKKTPPNW